MKTLVFVISLLVGTLALAQLPTNVGSLYTKDESGNLAFTCTASVVRGSDLNLKVDKVIMTAAHCVDDQIDKDAATGKYVAKTVFLVTFDEQTFYGANLLRVGRQSKGYDIALLTFAAKVPDVASFAIGDFSKLKLGDSLFNYGNPLGLGLQYFHGTLSMIALQRPIGPAGAMWKGYALSIMPSGPGSSGSLILDSNGAVVGVLIGVIQGPFGTPFTVIVPQSRFAAFMSSAEAARDIVQP